MIQLDILNHIQMGLGVNLLRDHDLLLEDLKEQFLGMDFQRNIEHFLMKILQVQLMHKLGALDMLGKQKHKQNHKQNQLFLN